jgi:hypothetical protein
MIGLEPLAIEPRALAEQAECNAATLVQLSENEGLILL